MTASEIIADRHAENVAREAWRMRERLDLELDEAIAAGDQERAKSVWMTSSALLGALIRDDTNELARMLDQIPFTEREAS